jgi:tetratricopeptide (TPR) repeat protein
MSLTGRISIKRVARWTTVVLLLSVSLCANAQDYRKLYRHARELFDQGKFELAMEAFRPLIIYDRNNPYAEYSSFYFGVSALKMGYHTVGRDMLLQLRTLHPGWPQMHEARYWLAKSYFDKGELFQGLHVLSEIDPNLFDPVFTADVAAMKRHYLKEVDDLETLRMAAENYPDDKEIGRATASVLGQKLYEPEVRHQFDSILVRFNFVKSDFDVDEGPISVTKDKYVVSLLFPFMVSTLSPSPGAARPNQSVLDMYNGMDLAVDTLATEGIHIELRSYDTERNNPQALNRILASPELLNSDLLVGPLFADEMGAVQQYSSEHRINMINPISNSLDYVRDNPFAFLFQSSHQTMGLRAAEVAAVASRNKNCIVYFGDTQKDSVMAHSFMKRASELGVNVVLAEEHHRESAGKILSTLATPTEFDENKNPKQFSLPLDSIGIIYVASDNALIYTKVNSSVTARGDSIVVIGSENWISPENTSVNFENYERVRILLASGNYASLRNAHYLAFRRRYMARHGAYPNLYAKLGYEFMMFIGHALHTHGTYFQQGLDTRGFTHGFMYEGYDFTDSHDNQYIPFVYFRNGELTVFNKKY